MRREGQSSKPSIEYTTGDKTHCKHTVTQARRDQNRRAQRAFRERLRAKKRCPLSSTPRLIAPRPLEEDLDGMVTPNEPNHTPSTSDRTCVDEIRDDGSSNGNEAMFTFSSPQTLLPTQKSLVPRRRTPYSDLLNLMRDHPGYALLPHGVTATLAACLFNGRALGIDIDQVMDPHYMSPFYRPSDSLVPSTASAVQPANLDAGLDAPLANLGLLRPCFAQLIFPHHACIDLLPLPRLRELAVMLNVRAQQEEAGGVCPGFDGVQELKKDVYIRQGVRFRGTGELGGDEYVLYDQGGQHRGHPWESGSWAIALWFTKKWRYLVDI